MGVAAFERTVNQTSGVFRETERFTLNGRGRSTPGDCPRRCSPFEESSFRKVLAISRACLLLRVNQTAKEFEVISIWLRKRDSNSCALG